MFGQDLIQVRLRKFIRPASAASFTTNKKIMPAYRFVDLWKAVEGMLKEYETKVIDSFHYEDLAALMTAEQRHQADRTINKATQIAWPVSPAEEDYFPVGRFWLGRRRARGKSDELAIFRLRYDDYSHIAILECSTGSAEHCKDLMDAVIEQSAEASIFRGRILRLSYEPGSKDDYGDIEKPNRLQVLFQQFRPIAEDDFVIDASIFSSLKRNVLDLHSRRAALASLGVPVRRGVLLFGPPGTGKTFACRYLAQRLENATSLFVTGRAMKEVAAIFSIARLLKPCCVFLEDADLAFAARELGGETTNLGDLLDQLDGLRSDEEIGVVVTTNSMERLESALKDRPGRISQCIHFGPPVLALRKRYISQYLTGYDADGIDLDALAAMTEGATQAFLKEWVHRGVQIASEGTNGTGFRIGMLAFDDAMKEMTKDANYFGQSLIGFAPRN